MSLGYVPGAWDEGRPVPLPRGNVSLARDFTLCLGIKGNLLIPVAPMRVTVDLGFLPAARDPTPRLNLGYINIPLFPGSYIDMSFLRPQLPDAVSTPPSFLSC